SRLIIAAIRPPRRDQVRALTLSTPGGGDGRVAAQIAQAFNVPHQDIDMSGLSSIDPAEAHERVIRSARHHDACGNPVNLAALTWAEDQVEPGVQLTGQAGELMRGMYFLEPHSATIKPNHIRRFVRVWFTSNESVSADALNPEFAESSHDALLEQVQEV